ncbi:MAG: hypothetical protein J7K35_02460 [Syntrophobacterales bacterium]|nr:hypothetical protein [Syntrophobacterales bacterium]
MCRSCPAINAVSKEIRGNHRYDSPREFCGVFGGQKAAEKTCLGLYALQHRRQESAGIAATDGKEISLYRGMGLVWSVFQNPDIMPMLAGMSAIGHNRYSTTGSSDLMNARRYLYGHEAVRLLQPITGTW